MTGKQIHQGRVGSDRNTPSTPTLPDFVGIMRHAPMQPATTPDEVLRGPALRDADSRGNSEPSTAGVTAAGRALAEALHELADAGDTFGAIHFVHENSDAARLTCEVLAQAYMNARLRHGWGKAPAPTPVEPLSTGLLSPYSDSACTTKWCQAVRDRLCELEARAGQRHAAVVVGHDPRMSILLHDLLGGPSRYLPALAHTELVACYRRRDRSGFVARWALSPTDKDADDAVRDKVRSKMDTAKLFAGVLLAVITFAADKLADLDGRYRTAALVGVAFLGMAVVLYLVTMFWYDRLLMPTRFWAPEVPEATGQPKPCWSPEPFLRRPPSSSTWVLYQNMQWVWTRCFLSATFSAGIGVTLWVLAMVQPDDWREVGAAIAGVGAVTAAATFIAWWSKPVLGVQD